MGDAGGWEDCSSCKHKLSSKAVNSLSFIWKRQALKRSNPHIYELGTVSIPKGR